jgi:uncharacterized protein (TIGR02246 family)
MRARLSLILLLLVGAVVPARAQQLSPDPELQQKIAQVTGALDAAFRRGDAAAVPTFFSDDAIVSFVDLEDTSGRLAIGSLFRDFAAANTVTAFQRQLVEVQVCGASAYERGTFLFIFGPAGQAPITQRGRYLTVWVRGPDGVWRIHRYMENLLPSSSPAR